MCSGDNGLLEACWPASLDYSVKSQAMNDLVSSNRGKATEKQQMRQPWMYGGTHTHIHVLLPHQHTHTHTTWRVKILATKFDDLSLFLRTHMLEGEQLLQIVLQPPDMHAPIYTHKINQM